MQQTMRLSNLLTMVSFSIVFCCVRTSLAGDGGGVNARQRLEQEQSRVTDVLDDSFSTWFQPGNVDDYLQFKERVKEDTGYEYLHYYTLMNHYGTEGGADSQNLNGQLHSINQWTPHDDCEDAGSLIFYYMHVAQYTGTTGGQLSNNLGLSSGINDSGGNVDLFRYVGWYQPLFDGNVEIDIGQLQLRDFFDLGDYASDDTRNFVSEIMAANPTATMPVAGLGIAVTARLVGDWYIGGGFSDANARLGDIMNFETFFEGDYASLGYVGYKGDVCGLGNANYMFSMYSVDATQQAAYSRGISTILEQEIGDRNIAFLKYRRADRRQNDTSQSMALGWMRKGICDWEDDLIGIGAGWGDPSNPARRDEYVLETFWRMQLTPGMQITPDLQIWLNPSQTPDEDIQAVFSIRALYEV